MDDNKVFIDKITEMTGKSIGEIKDMYFASGLSKHSDIRKLFIEKLELGYGYSNTLVHIVLATDSISSSEGKSLETILDEIYVGKKAGFRSIHDQIMKEVNEFGTFETVPKKGYLSLKCKKQFAMIGPKTNSRMEIGLNGKDIGEDERLIKQPSGGMCKYIIKITKSSDVDEKVIGWIHKAYIQSQ